MQNFLLRAKLFIAANKTFAAVVIIGAILVIMSAGQNVISIASHTLGIDESYNGMMARDLAGVPAMMGGGTAGGSGASDSYGYAEKGMVVSTSIAPMPPIYGTPASTEELPSDKKIIQNGSLSLLVESADTAAAKIETIAKDNGGFIQSSNIYEYTEGVKSGSVSVRVPSEKFTAVMEAIKDIATKVTSESVNTEDVTAQYVDLEAQIKNYQAEEAQYQQIMTRATKIDEILSVSAKLADVRGRIDRAKGQLNYLGRQVAMSTISISLTAEPEVRVFGIVWRPLTVIKQAFKSMLTDLAGFVDWLIRFIFEIPVYLVRLAAALIIIYVIWKILIWTKRRFWVS